MAVYGYTRVSTEGQEDKTSLDEQADRIAALAKARGWALTATFRDVASGTTFERPEFQKMLALLAPGDSVIVLALSRFSRSLMDGYPTLLAWEKRGIALLSVTESIDTTTAMGRHMLRICLEFAHAEREVLLERINAGRKRNAAKGGWNGGPVPYGYKRAPKHSAVDFEPDPAAAEIVARLFKLYATGRYGLGQLKAATGCPLSPSGIEGLLTNCFVLGRVRYEGIARPNRHVGLVSERLFRKVQQTRRARSAARPQRASEGVAATPERLAYSAQR